MPTTTESYTSNSQTVPIDVFQPATGGTHAGVLIVHGSAGLGTKYRADIVSFAEALVDSGIAATIPHYFVSASMKADDDGLPLIGVHYKTWRKACGEALEFMTGDARFDAARLGVIGFSLGAHFALSLGMDPPTGASLKCVVDFFGPTRHPPLEPHWSKLPLVLIHHGTADRSVDISESEFLVAELEAIKKKKDRDYFVEWYKGEGHGFTGAALTESRDATVEFVKKAL